MGYYNDTLNTVKAWMATRKGHDWVLERVQNRLDMQNTYTNFGSLTRWIDWLEDMAARERAEGDGTLDNPFEVPSSIAGAGCYDG